MTETMPAMWFSPDFVSAVEALADSEADRVGRLVAELEKTFQSNSGQPFPFFLPRGFLFALGLALRFHSWELNTIRFHLDAGLPSGAETLILAIRLLREPRLERRIEELSMIALRLFHQHFIWRAKTEFHIMVPESWTVKYALFWSPSFWEDLDGEDAEDSQFSVQGQDRIGLVEGG